VAERKYRQEHPHLLTVRKREYAVRRTTLKPFLLTFWGLAKSTSPAGAKPSGIDFEVGCRIEIVEPNQFPAGK